MDYVKPFRERTSSAGILRAIAAAVDPARTYRFMEFCGSHTHAIARYGIEALLPDNVRMIHGPG